MSNRWNISDIPHKGWMLHIVIDVREHGQAVEETDYETCMMCNNERIRYVHILTHPDIDQDFRVGCVCAEKMTNDYITPRLLEKKLKNTAARKTTWIKKTWKLTENGNLKLIFEDHLLLIFKDQKTNKFKCKIGNVWGKKYYDSIEEVKITVFDGIEYLKEKGKW